MQRSRNSGRGPNRRSNTDQIENEYGDFVHTFPFAAALARALEIGNAGSKSIARSVLSVGGAEPFQDHGKKRCLPASDERRSSAVSSLNYGFDFGFGLAAGIIIGMFDGM